VCACRDHDRGFAHHRQEGRAQRGFGSGYRRVGRHPTPGFAQGIMAAKKKELREITVESLGVAGGILVKTLRHEAPPARKAGVKVASVEELGRSSTTKAKVI